MGRVILLSGTPSSNRPIELFAQIRLINKQLFSSQKKFGKRYCDAKQTHFGWDYRGHSNLNELHAILTNQIMIRRLKENVLNELPNKIRQVAYLMLTEKE